MKKPLARFALRWAVCGLGLWIAAGFLKGGIDYDGDIKIIVVAGLILAIVNTFIKPLVVLLSLPALLFSLGLFLIVINGLMVSLASAIYEPFNVSGFGAAMITGVIIGLVNILVTAIVEEI